MSKISFLLFGLTLLFNQVSGQTFKQQFNDLLSTKDSVGQRQVLEKWEKSDRNDPELFVAYFNYYIVKSKKEIIALGQNPQGKEGFEIRNQDTTKNEPIAFMYGDTYYDSPLLSKGFEWISEGINKHPDRLDMRFGKIYMFLETKDYETFTTEIIKTIDYSNENGNKWTWTNSKPLDDPKEYMLGSIHDYQLELYKLENDELLDNMKRIAETVLKYYPDHVESLTNISIVFMIEKQYDKALENLLKAEQINNKDYIVLNNIARAYKLKGDNKNAIKYYKLMIKHGDKEAKKYAQAQIDELKKK
jgi:tetratricopeptide (TPR) repeat protein